MGDGLQVGPGAERAAGVPEDHGPDVGGGVQVEERRSEVGCGGGVHGVAHGGPVQHDGGDPAGAVDCDGGHGLPLFKPRGRPAHLNPQERVIRPAGRVCSMPQPSVRCDRPERGVGLPKGEEVIDEVQRARDAAEEQRLVIAAVRGSVPAFETLYRRHVARVHALCLRMTGHLATAEDCTQDAFVQAWRHLPRFETRSSFGTWLHRIAVNAVLQQARRWRETLGREDSVEREVAEVLVDPTAADPGAGRDLEHSIARLPPGARHVLVLVGLYGHTHEEAAAMLGIAVGTCKAQLHRARALLGAQLGREEGPPS